MTSPTLTDAARLPYGPLWTALGCPNDVQAAHRLGVDRSLVGRWRHQGVPAERSDYLAVKAAGRHPLAVWGPAWTDAMDAAEPTPSPPSPDDDPVQEPATPALRRRLPDGRYNWRFLVSGGHREVTAC